MPRRFALAPAALAAGCFAAAPGGARAAEPVMVQCGRAYQDAKAAGTLGGQDWAAFRAACAARLQASSAAPAAAPPAAAPPAAPAPVPAAVAPAAAASVPAAGGTAAMHARQKQCGAEWTAGKAALVAETPGLTWPKYWSRCNARIKATGR